MAGFLSMLPGILSAAGGSGGLLDKIKNVAGEVLNDLGSGVVTSGKDFGQSLARAGAHALLGTSPQDAIDKRLAAHTMKTTTNPADDQVSHVPPSFTATQPIGRGNDTLGSRYATKQLMEMNQMPHPTALGRPNIRHALPIESQRTPVDPQLQKPERENSKVKFRFEDLLSEPKDVKKFAKDKKKKKKKKKTA